MLAEAKYQCALVTGASAGLGAEFASQFAPDCASMVLVARRGERLLALANELEGRHSGLKVYCFAVDLCSIDQRQKFFSRLKSKGLQPDLLVNNAGMGDVGAFASSDWGKIQSMMDLNMDALTHCCHQFLPAMIAEQKGAIVNVSSLAATLPIPDFAVYAATKAYVSGFSEALSIELADHGVNVLAVCPGPVHTEFGETAKRGEQDRNVPGREYFYVEAQQVVSESIWALETGRTRVFPSLKITLAAVLIAATPLFLLRKVMANTSS